MATSWPRKLLKLTALVLGVPTLLAAGCYAKWCLLDGKFATITPGAVYQSAAFAPDELVETCRAHGIRTVIDLRDSRGELIDACAAKATAAGLHHLHVPTRSWPFPAEVEAFLAALDSAERPVLVHCQHGEGRSVLMCAMHRVANEGWSNRRAFEGTCRLPDSIKFLNDWFPSLRRFNPAHPKGKFVLSYRPKHTKEATAAAAGDGPTPLGATPR